MKPSSKRRLILFTRFPVAGAVKTRLIPSLGGEGAAALHRRLLLRTFRTALRACAAIGVELEIRFSGGRPDEFHHWLGNGFLCRPQTEGDLGQRMSAAFKESFLEGSTGTVIIGSDCPALTPARLRESFERLDLSPVVIGQAYDGGYYLIGLTRHIPQLFENIDWGTETVFAESVRTLAPLNMKPAVLEPLDDLDVPEDLPPWRRLIENEESDGGKISVVIPALNEAANIGATVARSRAGKPHEILVVDGGSTDDTARLAREAGALVIASGRGRSRQMNAGAARSTGNALLFLHADTLLPEGYIEEIARILAKPKVAAGAFRFQIDVSFLGKWIVESTANMRSRWGQMPYGDQGLFLRRALFEEMGGFANMPVMEDYEFVRRLRRKGRIETSRYAVRTSGRRWQKLGFLRATIINKQMVMGYRLGLPPARLAKIYRQET